MILDGGYKEQYQRVLRYLDKIKIQDQATPDHADDIWAFFQNCWHLKDWIKHDVDIPKHVRNSIEDEVKNHDNLMICADLANRSKHLELSDWSNKKDASMIGFGVSINLPKVIPSKGSAEIHVKTPFYIRTSENDRIDGLTVAQNAVKDWEKILTQYNLDIS